MSKHRIGLILCAVSLLSIFWIALPPAQAQGGRWSEPYRLSSEAGKASEGYCVADPYGYVHCFWTETLFEDGRTVIQYARFDGESWSTPNDIYVTGAGIESVSPVVDQHGTLHIAWVEGLYGPAYYTHAPAGNALSAQNWAEPLRIDIPAGIIRLRVDFKGVFHVLYINRMMEELGIYYVRSEDQGETWSEPAWLDPDILPDHTPDSLNFEIDENDGLHAVWFYGAVAQDARPDWVRYTHSLDGGNTWSVPFTIDQYVEGGHHNLTNASPIMIVQGQTVHVIWAGGEHSSRYHRFSTDAGQTWTLPRQIFADLEGQAFDGLAVDGAGRVHYFGQIRYPQGIYHAYWDQTQWTTPSLIYLILQGNSEDEEIPHDRIHAHHTHPVVRAGNQLVLTFADGPADPERRLFEVHRTLDDLSPLEAVPTPAPTATPVPPPSPSPQPPPRTAKPTAIAPLSDIGAPPFADVPRPDLTLRFALVPALFLLGGTFVFRLLLRRKHY